MLDVYNKAEVKPDAASKARVLSVLRAFPKSEPTKKKFVNEMVAWSAKFGEFPAGDPELHHVAGTLYADGMGHVHIFTLWPERWQAKLNFTEDEVYDAERHLILGTKDSPEYLARTEYDWYLEDESQMAPIYAARAIIPYLLTGNLRAANKAFLLFTSRLSSSTPGPVVQEVSSSSSDLRVYPTLPLFNFLGLLLLAVQRGEASLFRMLKTHYAANLKELDGAWDDALAQIGEMYFGIKIPSQSNPLFDMMGSMLMGGMKGGKKAKPKGTNSPAPPALD